MTCDVAGRIVNCFVEQKNKSDHIILLDIEYSFFVTRQPIGNREPSQYKEVILPV